MRAERSFIRRGIPAAIVAVIAITAPTIFGIAQRTQGHRFAAAGAEDFSGSIQLVTSFQSADDQIFISAGKIFFKEFLVGAGSDGGVRTFAGFVVHRRDDSAPEVLPGNFEECFADRQESVTVIQADLFHFSSFGGSGIGIQWVT